MRTIAVPAALTFLLVSCATQPAPAPPQETALLAAATAHIAHVDNLVETVDGASVSDPYRWMESGGEEFNAWIEAQRTRARAARNASLSGGAKKPVRRTSIA